MPDPNDRVRLGKDTAEAEFALTVVDIDAAANANSLTVADDPNYPYTLNINSGRVNYDWESQHCSGKCRNS